MFAELQNMVILRKDQRTLILSDEPRLEAKAPQHQQREGRACGSSSRMTLLWSQLGAQQPRPGTHTCQGAHSNQHPTTNLLLPTPLHARSRRLTWKMKIQREGERTWNIIHSTHTLIRAQSLYIAMNVTICNMLVTTADALYFPIFHQCTHFSSNFCITSQ